MLLLKLLVLGILLLMEILPRLGMLLELVLMELLMGKSQLN